MFPFLISYASMIIAQDQAQPRIMVKQWFLKMFYPDNFLSCYGLRHSRSFHFIFILLLLFHKVLLSGKLDPAKCFQCQIGWLKSTENEWEWTGKRSKKLKSRYPNKKKANSIPNRQQRNPDATGNVIWRYPRSKEWDKKVPRSGIQTQV